MPHGVILQRTSSAIFKRLYASGLPRRKRFASGGVLLHSLQGRRNRMRIQTHAIPTWVALACAMAGIAACDEPQAEQVVAPPQVSVITLQPSPRPYIRELPGRIAPTRVAEVRARVAGIVLERSFQQGADVKAGDVLYRIDPVRFEVELFRDRRRFGLGVRAAACRLPA